MSAYERERDFGVFYNGGLRWQFLHDIMGSSWLQVQSQSMSPPRITKCVSGRERNFLDCCFAFRDFMFLYIIFLLSHTVPSFSISAVTGFFQEVHQMNLNKVHKDQTGTRVHSLLPEKLKMLLVVSSRSLDIMFAPRSSRCWLAQEDKWQNKRN